MDNTDTQPGRDLLPEGLEDRLTPASLAAAGVTRAVMDVLDSHGYHRVQPPLIEFERSLGARMEVATRRMFRFTDPASLRTLALRADITPQIGRLAATRLAAAARPLRLAYAGQVLTISGVDGKGGLKPARERLQLGAELIGADSAAAASEVVAVAVEALTAAGARGVTVDFTLPDLVETLAAGPLPLPPERIPAVRAALDAKDAGGLVAAGGAAYLPLLEAIGPLAEARLRLAAFDTAGALASRLGWLDAVAARLGDAVRLTLDPTERHGFEYQSWLGFTLYAQGVRGALGRGGTYRILGRAGDGGEAATGFSLYPDPLIDLVAAAEPPRHCLFLPLGHDAAAAARFRAEGWRTVAALSDTDAAAALGCSHQLIEGQPHAV